jgi:uncharacterized protein YegP (UPF0339 family)
MANEQKFEIWKSKNNNNWYWRFKAGNGEIVAGGEGYTTKQNCIHAIGLIQNGANTAKIYNLTPEPK